MSTWGKKERKGKKKQRGCRSPIPVFLYYTVELLRRITVIHCHALLLSRRIFIRGRCATTACSDARCVAPSEGGNASTMRTLCIRDARSPRRGCDLLRCTTLWLVERKVGGRLQQLRHMYENPAVSLRLFLSLLLLILLLRLYCHYSYYYDYSSYYCYH